MIIRKPYDVSSSEASRIRNLHESVNNLITEGTPCSSWLSIMGPGNSGDVDCCQVLADGPSGANWHMAQPNGLCSKHWIGLGQTLSSGWQNCCSVVIPTNPTNPISSAKMKPKTDNQGVSRNADLEEIRYMNELYDITLGHEDTPNPLEMEENWMYDKMRREFPDYPWEDPIEDGESTSNPAKRGIREETGCCTCPMGHDDFPGCTHDCCDDIKNPAGAKSIKESIYELPKRFGNKRLTETQLIDMVNSIVKKY